MTRPRKKVDQAKIAELDRKHLATAREQLAAIGERSLRQRQKLVEIERKTYALECERRQIVGKIKAVERGAGNLREEIACLLIQYGATTE